MTKELGDPRAIDSEGLVKTAKQLDVSQVNIEILQVRPPQLNATNEPTLQEVLRQQKEACDDMREELREIEERRHEQRGITQKWHFLKGSVAWLQDQTGGGEGAAGGGEGGGGSFKQTNSRVGNEQLRVLRRLNEVEEQVMVCNGV